jgi:hypothetical protein
MATKLNVPLPAKGLVVDRPAEYVDSRSAVNTKNMEFNRSIIRKRSGTIALGTTLGERVQRYFELQVGSSTRLFRVGLSKVEVLNKATLGWSSVATAPLTGAVTDQVSYAFPLLAGAKITVYTNGKDVIKKCSISGSDAALGGSPPLARHAIAYGPYLVLAYITDGGNTYYSRVQWCDTGDPETWSGTGTNAGSQDLIDDPEDITGLGVFGNALTVHKSTSIYVGQLVTTADVFRFDRKATGVGAVSGATIQNIPSGEQIFLATDGIHLFNGVTAPLIDSPVQDELREEMNPAYLYKSQAIFVRELDEYWVCVPVGSETEPSTIYKYNWRSKQVYKDYRSDLCAMGLFLNTVESLWDDRVLSWDSATDTWNSASNSSLTPIVVLGTSAGLPTRRSVAAVDDLSTAVESVWDTKDFTAEDLGSPDMDRIVRWKGLEVWAKGNSVTISYSLDGGASWIPAGSLTLGSEYPPDDAPLNVYFDAVCSRIRFRFSNGTTASGFTLKKYQIEATLREARK